MAWKQIEMFSIANKFKKKIQKKNVFTRKKYEYNLIMIKDKPTADTLQIFFSWK